jgi:hypothetical protein
MRGGAVTVVWRNEINEEVLSSPPLPCLSVCLVHSLGGEEENPTHMSEEGEEGSSQTHLVLEEDTTPTVSGGEEPVGWRSSLVKLGIRKSENRCAVSDRDGKSMLISELCHAAGSGQRKATQQRTRPVELCGMGFRRAIFTVV